MMGFGGAGGLGLLEGCQAQVSALMTSVEFEFWAGGGSDPMSLGALSRFLQRHVLKPPSTPTLRRGSPPVLTAPTACRTQGLPA